MEKVNLEKVAEELAGSSGSLIEGNPEDVGVGKYAEVPTNPEKEHEIVELKRKLLDHKNLKIDSAMADEILKQIGKGNLEKIPLERLINLAVKMRPQKTESKIEHVGSFMHWIMKVKGEEKKYETIDAEKD